MFAFPINDRFSKTVSPILIVGCGRSGNTLLRSMLVQGGEVFIPPETYVWSAVARGYSRWRYSNWETVVTQVVDAFKESEFALSERDFVAIKAQALLLPDRSKSLAAILNLIYGNYCELNDAAGRRWGDKTPLNILDIRVLEPIFPAAQYVHVVRDPRAVAISYVKAARISPGIREKSFADAALRWNKSVHNARWLAAKVGSDRFIEVRYEDLLKEPERELNRVCRFLGQTYTSAMMSFYEGADKLGDVPAHAHHYRIHDALDSSRSDQWASEISGEDRARVEAITSRYRALLHYD